MVFCNQCGQQLNDDTKFCTRCGTLQVPQPTHQAPVAQPQTPKGNHTKLVVALVAVALCAVGGYFHLTTNQQVTDTEQLTTVLTWQEQYDLGMKYLSEGNYEEAIIAFTAAIELEPMEAGGYLGRAQTYLEFVDLDDALALALADYEMVVSLDSTNPEGYWGLAEVYIAMGDFDAAMAILQQGIGTATDVTALQERLNGLEEGSVSDYWGNVRKISRYDDDGTLQWYAVYDFEQGRKSKLTTYDPSGAVLNEGVFEYDEAGNVVVNYLYAVYGDGAIVKEECQYDADGNCIRINSYGWDGVYSYYMLYTYEAGQVVREEYYDVDGTFGFSEEHEWVDDTTEYSWQYGANGELERYFVRTYNEDGTLACDESYSADGTLEQQYTYAYDQEGNIESMTSYDPSTGGGVVMTYN